LIFIFILGENGEEEEAEVARLLAEEETTVALFFHSEKFLLWHAKVFKLFLQTLVFSSLSLLLSLAL
jgi:hypothetical protein